MLRFFVNKQSFYLLCATNSYSALKFIEYKVSFLDISDQNSL